MQRSHRTSSLFSQRLDRALFSVYLLSAVVPLGAFAFVGQRYALPMLESDAGALTTLLGSMVGIVLLSLASFFALRRIVSNAVAQMKLDNARLQKVLAASNEFSSSPHTQAVAKLGLQWIRRLSGAKGALLLIDPGEEKPLELIEALGRSAPSLFEGHRASIEELVATALRERRTVSLYASQEHGGNQPTVFVAPFPQGTGCAGALVALFDPQVDPLSSQESDALAMLSAITAAAWQNAEMQEAQRNFFTHVTDLLVSAVDHHVAYREGHSKMVAEISNRVGREMGLGDERLQALHFAALLHDIGMLKLERSLHARPQHYQKHPLIAHRVLSRIRLWGEVAPIVLHHHEHFDGSGYPGGLKEDAIPLESRIIALADAVDAMSRDDDRHAAIDLEEIIEELRAESGSQFDPAVVEAFFRVAERGEIPPPS